MKLKVPAGVVRSMVKHARSEAPRECCGLLSGVEGEVRTWHPLDNESDSADEFLCSVGLFGPFKRMRQRGEVLLAIYHSHVSTPPVPSAKDRERNYYPDVVHVIVSLAGPEPMIRGYRMLAEAWEEVPLLVEEDSTDDSSRPLDVSAGIPM